MKYVCVVGGTNIDITGTPHTPIKQRDSNPSVCKVSLGGVGRNIAENLARMGIKVVFITALGTDRYADSVKDNAAMLNIDISHSLVVKGNTSTYLCINDHTGDMYVAASDMHILDELTPKYLQSKLDVLNNAACIVADANLTHCLSYILDNAKVPVFVDTVSAKKTEIIKSCLHNVFALKPNIYEAEILSDSKIDDQKTLTTAMQKIAKSADVKWLCVSNGDKGVTYLTDGAINHCPAYKVDVVNTTGAGDSFMAGLVCGYVRGFDIHRCVSIGCAASSITIGSDATVSPDMSWDKIMTIIDKEIH